MVIIILCEKSRTAVRRDEGFSVSELNCVTMQRTLAAKAPAIVLAAITLGTAGTMYFAHNQQKLDKKVRTASLYQP